MGEEHLTHRDNKIFLQHFCTKHFAYDHTLVSMSTEATAATARATNLFTLYNLECATNPGMCHKCAAYVVAACQKRAQLCLLKQLGQQTFNK